jgi:phosphoribosylanthranilate isomerase
MRPGPVRVKICGITSLDDAMAAADAGADALGFNFWPKSKRYISPARAAKIIEKLPVFVSAVGLFVNAKREEIERDIRRSGISLIQLHGDESPRFCRAFSVPVLKAIPIQSPDSVKLLSRYPVSGFVLDTPSDGYGGSGTAFNWQWVRGAARKHTVLLAGGLNPHNVADAVRRVRPYGVDVASGVESSPGKKDHRAVRRFVVSAKLG